METSIERLFFSGEHREIALRTIDAPSPTFSNEDFAYVIGALVMLGRIDEAETAYWQRSTLLTEEQLVATRYFLGNGFCRHSYYPKCRAYFIENLRAEPTENVHLCDFYRYQGLGFYHYFAGKMKKALSYAEKAFNAALAANSLYGRAVSSDLKGHCLVQTGQIELGLKTLERAEQMALNVGAKWMREAIQSTLIIYRCRYGMGGTQQKNVLIKKLKSLSKQDIYTQSSMLLQLAEINFREGALSEAKEALDECCRIVYGSQNRRHAALLNLRYAYAHYLEGDSHLALNLVRNAITQIDSEVDKQIELKLKGFEKKLVLLLNIEVCPLILEEKQVKLTRKVGERVAIRILDREKVPMQVPMHYGEDLIGDLLDSVKRYPKKSVEAILSSGYYGFLLDVLPEVRGKKILYLDLESDSLTLFDKGNVKHFKEVLSPSLRNILYELSQGAKTKKELIEKIWKYDYHPLRHDSLIYSAMTKLRKILGKYSHWIEASDIGYHLSSSVEIRRKSSTVSIRSTEVTPLSELNDVDALLNHRQQKILRFLSENEFIDTMTCLDLFNTSEVTASRDLSELTKLQLVVRTGKGRATKYTSLKTERRQNEAH